jgi:alpha-tubulin suppressor-like RCC1 family protein
MNSQLGESVTTAISSVPIAIPTASTVSLVAGGYHTCAIDAGRTVRCWGANSQGQLGNGVDTVDNAAPESVAALGSVDALALGEAFSCSRVAGDVLCWGRAAGGEVGSGSVTARELAPVSAGLTGATDVAAGKHHACAVDSAGNAVRCWGINATGQLGADASATPDTCDAGAMFQACSRIPVTANSGMATISRVSAGDAHTCALGANARVYCWGNNADGQLGDGSLVGRSTGEPVVGLTSDTQIVTGAHVTCAIADGGAWCWGRMSSGTLGDGITAQSPVPIAVAVPNAVELGVREGTVCARDADGAVWCWGANDVGQAGGADTSMSIEVPIRVALCP